MFALDSVGYRKPVQPVPDLMSRRVLVTGASSGIGLATALEAARLGFEVFGSARDEQGAEAIRKSAEEAGITIEPVLFDLTDEGSYGPKVRDLDLWAVVNNAGYPNAGAVEDIPLDEARRQLEVMVIAPAALTLEALPAMRRRGSGRIVNIGSVAVGTGVPMLGWYQTSKHALSGIGEALRNELRDSGVEVISVDPSGIDTPIWDRARRDLDARFKGSAQRRSYERAIRVIDSTRRWMRRPEAVAKTVGKALTSGKPHASYPVGLDGYLLAWGGRYAPRRFIDWVSRKALDA